jgi:hypothetical protein
MPSLARRQTGPVSAFSAHRGCRIAGTASPHDDAPERRRRLLAVSVQQVQDPVQGSGVGQQQMQCSSDGCQYPPVSRFNLLPYDAADILDVSKCRHCNSLLYAARGMQEAQQDLQQMS